SKPCVRNTTSCSAPTACKPKPKRPRRRCVLGRARAAPGRRATKRGRKPPPRATTSAEAPDRERCLLGAAREVSRQATLAVAQVATPPWLFAPGEQYAPPPAGVSPGSGRPSAGTVPVHHRSCRMKTLILAASLAL